MPTKDKPLYAYDEKTSGGEWARISYYLVETEAPAGYEADPSKKIRFRLFKDAKNIHETIDYASSDDTIIITNTPVGASISKVDENGNPLKGVYLSILDEDGQEVATWVSSTVAKIFPLSKEQEKGKLVPDTVYTLKELKAPTGYTGLTGDVKFMVDAKGTVTLQNRSYNYQNEPEAWADGSLLTVKNIPLPSIGFMKVDSLTMEGVAGAKLELRKDGPQGEIVEKEWETTKEAHELEGGLEAGTYCLVENAFPNGYDDTQENYVIFKVNEKGAITEVSPDEDRAVITDSGMTLRLKNKKLQADPTPSVNPSPSPSTKPSPSPSTSPSTKPSPSPSTSPSTKPSPSPSTSPSTKPSPSPSASPSTKPSSTPSASPVTTPTATPSATPEMTPAGRTEPEFTEIRVTKKWQDLDDYDEIRPEAVTIHLERRVAGGEYETVDTIEMTGEGDTWTYTFQELPVRSEKGLRYQYRVREEEVEGYTVEYDGYSITNVHVVVTPTPEITPLPTPTNVGPKPERAVGMKFQDGEWIWIDDMGVPLGVVAVTGDSDNLTAVLVGMALFLAGACGLAFTIVGKGKRKHA